MRILVIEDSVRLGELISDALRRQAFTVDVATAAGQAEAALRATFYDLMILDLGLPDYDGAVLLASVRDQGIGILVLVLTSRDRTQAVVDRLNGGADDFLSKPFDMNELIARVRALLRRPGKPLSRYLSEGNVTFDTVDRDIRVGEALVNLTRLEAGALELLMRSSGRVVTKSSLEESLYGVGEAGCASAVEVVLHRLRKKLLAAGASVKIETLRGIGYIILDAS